MTVRDIDQQIMAEANRQREHELQLAQERGRVDLQIARHKNEAGKHRREVIGYTLGTLFACLTLLTIILAVIWNVRASDDDSNLRRQRQQQSYIESCIDRGGAWIDGNCIPTIQKVPVK